MLGLHNNINGLWKFNDVVSLKLSYFPSFFKLIELYVSTMFCKLEIDTIYFHSAPYSIVICDIFHILKNNVGKQTKKYVTLWSKTCSVVNYVKNFVIRNKNWWITLKSINLVAELTQKPYLHTLNVGWKDKVHWRPYLFII